MGASPELLVRREGARAQTVALAGTARRSADPAVDDHLGEQLLHSPKDRAEHAIVAARIERTLDPVSLWTAAAREPGPVQVHNVQHLATPIRAQLREPLVAVELAGLLASHARGRRRAARGRAAADPGAGGPRPRLVRGRGRLDRPGGGRRVLRGPALRAAARARGPPLLRLRDRGRLGARRGAGGVRGQAARRCCPCWPRRRSRSGPPSCGSARRPCRRAIAASSVSTTIATRAMMPPVVSVPSSIGMRGARASPARCTPSRAIAASTARTIVDDQADDPHAQALAAAVEARHAPAHVAAAVVGEHQDQQQHDAADEADRLGVAGTCEPLTPSVSADRRAGGADDAGEDGRHANGHQPAEEGRAPVDAAVLVALAGAHLAYAGCRGLVRSPPPDVRGVRSRPRRDRGHLVVVAVRVATCRARHASA